MRGALGAAPTSRRHWAPWCLAGLGLLLPVAVRTIRPPTPLVGPVTLRVGQPPPLGSLGGEVLARMVRIVPLELVQGSELRLSVHRARSTKAVTISWALASLGDAAVSTNDRSLPPGTREADIRLGWFPPGSYALHLLARGTPEEGSTSVHATVSGRSLPPPWLEAVSSAMLLLPLGASLLRRLVGS